MPPKELLDRSKIDPSHVFADIEAIRAVNPQRHEFEQLSRICYFDEPAGEVAGVLDVPPEPWWGRGHVPGRPLMPGVLMLESLAQVCSWAVHQVIDGSKHPGKIFGFGGIDKVKFRGAVFPPAEFLILAKAVDIRTRRAVMDTQGWIGDKLIVEAQITGLWV